MKDNAYLGHIDNLEHMSAAEHAKWASWQKHVFNKCEKMEDGSMVIPAIWVERWGRQIETSYMDLSENEKQSDRDVVLKYFAVLPFVDV